MNETTSRAYSETPEKPSKVTQQKHTRTTAESLLNNFSDIELQGILLRYYHKCDPRSRPSMDEVRNRIATLLGIVGPHGLPARDAVILLAQAGWDAIVALRQFINNTRPQLQQ
ncbi:MAG: hypothetical protein L6R38_000907 [Xanthoria sp. 2 TBL-2021]|nr:MAG: hypothetical protein L6R38_000907 [Xanthoria sp. 2 TBL-2021]